MFSRRARLASPTISRTDWPSGVRSELRYGIRSSSVKTACTPDVARAARVLILLMVACACGERTNTADSVPGGAMSSAKRPLPVSSAGSSTRAVRAPTLILPVLTLFRAWGAAQSGARAARSRLPSPGAASRPGAGRGPAADIRGAMHGSASVALSLGPRWLSRNTSKMASPRESRRAEAGAAHLNRNLFAHAKNSDCPTA
jgi:hypothetical protein